MGWSEREVRHAAEVAGDSIVREPRGLALCEKVGTDEILHCARIVEAQSSKIDQPACPRPPARGGVTGEK